MPTIKIQRALDRLGFTWGDIKDVVDLGEDAREDSYWDTASTFVIELADRDYRELSIKQIKWAVKIQEQLADMRRKGKL